MDVAFQRKVDRIVGVPICRILSWSLRLKKNIPEPIAPSAILVIILSEMGSLVLAAPMFRRLRELHPSADLHALVFERNREALQMLDVVPPENILGIADEGFGGLVRDSFRTIQRLRRCGIQAVIDCELFARISSIFSLLSGARTRVGFHPHTQEGLYRGDFINRPVLYNPYAHMALQFLGLAEAMTSATTPKNKRPLHREALEPPRIKPAPADIQSMQRRLAADFPKIQGRRLVLIHPGGGILPIRAWPAANYLAVTRRLLEAGFAVGIIGLTGDKSLAEEIRTGCGDQPCVDLTGYTRTIHELLQLFHLAELLITNDGGPGHLASLTPLRTVMLFGPETPLLYKPLGGNTVALYEPIGCSPCLTAYNHRNSPCDGDNECLKKIDAERVLAEAFALLGNTPGRAWAMKHEEIGDNGLRTSR